LIFLAYLVDDKHFELLDCDIGSRLGEIKKTKIDISGLICNKDLRV